MFSDTALLVLLVWLVIASPALLLLPWILFTRTSRVRKILFGAFTAALFTPFAVALITDWLGTICERGHIDEYFGDCGVVSDTMAYFLQLLPVLVFLLPAFAAAVYCTNLEIQRFRSSE